MNLRKKGCWFLALIVAVSLTVPIQVHAADRFNDTAGHWAENYINQAVSYGFVNGYPDGTFLPDKAVTRAEFTTMVNKALTIKGSGSVSFHDVPYNEWYYSDVAKAIGAAYAGGYNDDTFRPNNAISRQEAAVMISRLVPVYGAGGNLSSYSDYRDIADWASAAVSKVSGKGYIGAYNDGKIHPLDQLTRAQTAKILCDILQKESVVAGNTVMKSNGERLSGKICTGDVTIHKDLGENSASIENCVLLGNLTVQGGGVNTITVSNSRVANAAVDKSNNPVRILASGETAIVSLSASRSSVLQTSSLSGGLFGPGFGKIDVTGSADVTLKGSFPLVNISGSKANVTLNSGSVSELTVSGGGKYSNITAENGTTVENATVNAEAYFHGTGTVSNMNVNAGGITYETKPKKWTIASSSNTPSAAAAKLSLTFNPKNGATNVYLDSNITLTFGSALKMYDGSSVRNSNVDDFITLRKSSANGSKINFSGSIDSDKKVITIDPDSNLAASTRYYVVVDQNGVKDANGNGNQAETIYFNTGTKVSSVSTSYSPSNGASSISTGTNVTITFSDDVVRYSNGATISTNDSYLKDCIVFKKSNSSGENVAYSASINSSKKVITIDPSSSLALNQTYYVAIVANKLKTGSGVIPASNVTWSTGTTTPVVNTLTLSSGVSDITASVTSNIAGTAYLVALPSGSAAPSSAQVVAGQNASGVPVSSSFRTSGAVSAGSAKGFSMSGFASNTQYVVYVVVNGNGLNSAVKSGSVSTSTPTSRLTSLSVIPDVPGLSGTGNQISFNPSTSGYNVALNTGITSITIAATGDGMISINNGTASSGSASASVGLTGSGQTIPVTISKDGTTSTTYTVTVTPTNKTALSSLTVKANGTTLNDSGEHNYQLPDTEAASIQIDAATADPFAVISMSGGSDSIHTGSSSFSLDPSTSNQTYTFSVTSGSSSVVYTITFIRPAPPVTPDPPADSVSGS